MFLNCLGDVLRVAKNALKLRGFHLPTVKLISFPKSKSKSLILILREFGGTRDLMDTSVFDS